MFWLFRRFCTLVGFIVVCLALLYLARNQVVEYTLHWLIPHSTTFESRIDRVEVESGWPLKIRLDGLRIENPPDFEDRLALEIPRAYLALAPDGWNWHAHAFIFSQVSVEISRLNLVNTEPGGNNLIRFSAVARQHAGTTSGFDIQTFQLEVTDPGYPHFGRPRRYIGVDSQQKLAAILNDIASGR